MAMDKEVIKSALDAFENDEFVDAKEILSKEIRKTKDAYIQDKLGLKGEPEIDKKVDTEDE